MLFKVSLNREIPINYNTAATPSQRECAKVWSGLCKMLVIIVAFYNST